MAKKKTLSKQAMIDSAERHRNEKMKREAAIEKKAAKKVKEEEQD